MTRTEVIKMISHAISLVFSLKPEGQITKDEFEEKMHAYYPKDNENKESPDLELESCLVNSKKLIDDLAISRRMINRQAEEIEKLKGKVSRVYNAAMDGLTQMSKDPHWTTNEEAVKKLQAALYS